jgi:hypothetical protein
MLSAGGIGCAVGADDQFGSDAPMPYAGLTDRRQSGKVKLSTILYFVVVSGFLFAKYEQKRARHTKARTTRRRRR